MACSDFKKWADKINDKIKQLDHEVAVEAEKDAAIKRAITGLAKALESIGLSVELGYTSPVGASAKIKLQPKHSETAAGAFEAWEGWKQYTQAGGKMPSASATRQLLVKARRIALDEYQNCHQKTRKKAVWTGYVKATFTERCNRNYVNESGTAGSVQCFWEEVHTWTITGKPDPSDGTYPATWNVKVKLSWFKIEHIPASIFTSPDDITPTLVDQVLRSVIPETTGSFSAASHLAVSEDAEGGYHVTCGYDGKYAPNVVTYTQTETLTLSSGGPLTASYSDDVSELVVGVDGSLKNGAARGQETKDTLWSRLFMEEEGVRTLKTDWSLKRTVGN
jgi:hypothetical protein